MTTQGFNFDLFNFASLNNALAAWTDDQSIEVRIDCARLVKRVMAAFVERDSSAIGGLQVTVDTMGNALEEDCAPEPVQYYFGCIAHTIDSFLLWD